LLDIGLGVHVSYMDVHYAISALGPKSSEKEVAAVVFAGGFIFGGWLGGTHVWGSLDTHCDATRANEGFIVDCRGCHDLPSHMY
jgi:hypothetical protein